MSRCGKRKYKHQRIVQSKTAHGRGAIQRALAVREIFIGNEQATILSMNVFDDILIAPIVEEVNNRMTVSRVKDTNALTSIGLEVGSVEEVQAIKGGLEGLVVGHVLTCLPHPNSDHMHVCTVDLGQEAPVQIVCGAPNVAAGQKVIVATLGTKLYGEGDEKPVLLCKAFACAA